MNVDFLNKYTETARGKEFQSIYGKKISSFSVPSLYRNENTNGLFSRRLIVGESEIFFSFRNSQGSSHNFFFIIFRVPFMSFVRQNPFMFLFLVIFQHLKRYRGPYKSEKRNVFILIVVARARMHL